MSLAATEDSRQRGGTLSLDATPFAQQVYTAELVPAVQEEGDRLEMLNGNELGPDERTEWSLSVGAVQDFDDPAGFLEFLRANAGTTVPFVWEPNAVDAPTYSGDLTVRAGRIGGATRVRLTSEITFPVVTLDEPAYPV